MTGRRFALAGLALLLLAAGVAWHVARLSPDGASGAARSADGAAGRLDATGAGHASAATEDTARDLLAGPIAADRAALLARLASSPDARDAWRAYDLVHQCLEWRRAQARMADDPEARPFLERAMAPYDGACLGVDDSAVARRLDALRRAAEAHVPGAAVALLVEGPRGDGAGQQDRAERAAWWREVRPLLVDAAAQGDRNAVATLAQVLETGLGGAVPPDYALAYRYELVEAEFVRARHAGALPPTFQHSLDELTSHLAPIERERAEADAKRLLATSFADAAARDPAQ